MAELKVDNPSLINGMPSIHPGEFLREDFLKPLGMSVNALALALRVPVTRMNEIVREKRGISVDTAMRLARYFGTSVEFWLNMRRAYELKKAAQENKETIDREVIPRNAA